MAEVVIKRHAGRLKGSATDIEDVVRVGGQLDLKPVVIAYNLNGS